ncbi:MAG: protein kinase [Cyanobacteria bacterium J06641_5]
MPDPQAVPKRKRQATIVIVGIGDSSANVPVEDERILSRIHQDFQLVEDRCQQYNGRVLRSTAVSLLMYFISSPQAMEFAVTIQKFLNDDSSANSDRPPYRVGVHRGDISFEGSEIKGDSIQVASHLLSEAKPGGICLSRSIYESIGSQSKLSTTPAEEIQIQSTLGILEAYSISVSVPAPARGEESKYQGSQLKRNIRSLPETLAIGDRLRDRYTITKVLGQGAFGISYLVKDTQRFDEPCVIKEFRPVGIGADEQLLQKSINLFEREAKTLYQIDHRQVPKFMAYFTRGHKFFIVQEYIDGINYLQQISNLKKQGKVFSEGEITIWLYQMLQVLDYLHGLGIMHRDISPENIMYSPKRRLPVLIDFGLVNDTMSSELHPEVDLLSSVSGRSATVAGKFGYSPPEQVHLGQCTPSADLYALGVTALVLLTAKHPRKLIDPATLTWTWQSHARVGSLLTAILTQLTQQRPEERFQSASSVIQQLAPLLPAGMVSPPVQAATVLKTTPKQASVVSQQHPRQATPAFIKRCDDALKNHIGPMASVILGEVLDESPNATPRELLDALAHQIPDAKRAEAFLNDLRDSDELQENERLEKNATLTEDFIDRCRRALTQCVGPMADAILDEVRASTPGLTATVLVEQLAAEISQTGAAEKFLHLMETPS